MSSPFVVPTQYEIESADAVAAMEWAAEWLEAARRDPGAWPGAMVALRKSVYGLMFLALRSTWPVRTMKRVDRRRKVQAEQVFRLAVLEGDAIHVDEANAIMLEPVTEYASFLEMYESINDSGSMHFLATSVHFSSRREEGVWIDDVGMCRLDELAEAPHDLITQAEYAAVANSAVHVMWFLVTQSGNIMWHPAVLKARAIAALDRLNGSLGDSSEIHPRFRVH